MLVSSRVKLKKDAEIDTRRGRKKTQNCLVMQKNRKQTFSKEIF